MKRQDFRFFHRLRVRWAEVDMQKIVFNAHYLMYFDTAIADYWRAIGLPYEAAMEQLEGDLYVKKATSSSMPRPGRTTRSTWRCAARASAPRPCSLSAPSSAATSC
jgi:hypothetical protein